MTRTLTDTEPRPAPAAPATGGSPLAGTGTLIRFILRRDRIKLPAWLLGIAVLPLYYGAALPQIYPTQQDLQGLALFMEGPVGAIFSGPGYGRDDLNIERVVVGVYGLWIFLLAAIMTMLLISRHTRMEEQNGRAELIRANVVGRFAPLTAALVVALGANVLLALLVGGGMAANGFDAGQSLLFGASVGAVGLVFAGFVAVTVQVSEYSRAAVGYGFILFGGAWIVRAVGDMLGDHGSPLSWFSPLAWSQQTRPYVDGRWWPLLISVGVTAAAVVVAYRLSAQRDLGAGLVAASRGRASAAPWLGSPLAYAFRLQRAGLIGWAIALGVGGVLWGAITDTMARVYDGMSDDMLALLGGSRDQLTEGYLGVMGLFDAFLVAIVMILGVQSMRFEETKGRAEPVLATAVSRWRWLGSYLAVLAGGAAALLLLAGVAIGIGAAISTGEARYVWELALGHLAFLPPVLVLLAVAALLFGVFPRAIGLTWVVLGYGFMVGFFGPIMDLSQAVLNLSLFEHIPQAPLEPLTWPPVLILTAVAAGLAALGLVAFRRRDLETK